jgi:hypothetical protein
MAQQCAILLGNLATNQENENVKSKIVYQKCCRSTCLGRAIGHSQFCLRNWHVDYVVLESLLDLIRRAK